MLCFVGNALLEAARTSNVQDVVRYGIFICSSYIYFSSYNLVDYIEFVKVNLMNWEICDTICRQ